MREAEPVGQNDQLHGVEVRPGAEAARVEVLEHRPHAGARRVGEQHLGDTTRSLGALTTEGIGARLFVMQHTVVNTGRRLSLLKKVVYCKKSRK